MLVLPLVAGRGGVSADDFDAAGEKVIEEFVKQSGLTLTGALKPPVLDDDPNDPISPYTKQTPQQLMDVITNGDPGLSNPDGITVTHDPLFEGYKCTEPYTQTGYVIPGCPEHTDVGTECVDGASCDEGFEGMVTGDAHCDKATASWAGTLSGCVESVKNDDESVKNDGFLLETTEELIAPAKSTSNGGSSHLSRSKASRMKKKFLKKLGLLQEEESESEGVSVTRTDPIALASGAPSCVDSTALTKALSLMSEPGSTQPKDPTGPALISVPFIDDSGTTATYHHLYPRHSEPFTACFDIEYKDDVNNVVATDPEFKHGCTPFRVRAIKIKELLSSLNDLYDVDGKMDPRPIHRKNGYLMHKIAWYAQTEKTKASFSAKATNFLQAQCSEFYKGAMELEDCEAMAADVFPNEDATFQAVQCYHPLTGGTGMLTHGLSDHETWKANANTQVALNCKVHPTCSRLAELLVQHFAQRSYSKTSYWDLGVPSWGNCQSTTKKSNCRLHSRCFVKALHRVCGDYSKCCPDNVNGRPAKCASNPGHRNCANGFCVAPPST